MSKYFDFIETPFEGLYKIKHRAISDLRGHFTRLLCIEEFKQMGFNQSVVQINQTLTKLKGSIRGMHFQYPPNAETKIVTCIQGEIMDIVVDIRCNSPTFLQWYSQQLSDKNRLSLYIPEGFAHGFQALRDNCQLIYMHSSPYVQISEGGIDALDPKLEIAWPLKITEMSNRDQNHKRLDNNFIGMTLS